MSLLIQFAHPAPQKSRANRALLAAARQVQGVTVNDLYEEYPDFHVDVAREQALLATHEVVVFQHPFYWYSAPALVKEWQDLVLTIGLRLRARRDAAAWQGAGVGAHDRRAGGGLRGGRA